MCVSSLLSRPCNVLEYQSQMSKSKSSALTCDTRSISANLDPFMLGCELRYAVRYLQDSDKVLAFIEKCGPLPSSNSWSRDNVQRRNLWTNCFFCQILLIQIVMIIHQRLPIRPSCKIFLSTYECVKNERGHFRSLVTKLSSSFHSLDKGLIRPDTCSQGTNSSCTSSISYRELADAQHMHSTLSF